MAKIMKSKIRLYCLLVLGLFHSQVYSRASSIIRVEDVNFMDVLPVPGNCNIHVDTSVLTGSICASNTGVLGDVGHYRITADPGININIIVYSKPDSGDGVIAMPSGKITTDSAADISFSADVGVNVNSGVSGEINIFIGGRLTFTVNKGFSTAYTVNYDIEFNEL